MNPVPLGPGAGIGHHCAPTSGAWAHCSVVMDAKCLAVPCSPQSLGTPGYLYVVSARHSGVVGSMMIPSQTFLGKAEQNE